MVKVFVVYDTKYGNTRRVAENIVAGLSEFKEVETDINDVELLDIKNVVDFDVLLIGSPNHIGKPAHSISRFINRLGKIDLKAKWFAVFDTYMGDDYEIALKKMEKKICEKIPSLQLLTSGLSIKVKGMRGPIVEEDLPKSKDFGKKIAKQLLS